MVSIRPLSSHGNHAVGEVRCSLIFSKANCISVEFAKWCGYLVYVVSYVGAVGTWVECVKSGSRDFIKLILDGSKT